MARAVRRIKDLGPLQDLLLRCCTPDTKGRRSISILAKQLGLTSCAVYKWISEEYVPQKRIAQLVKHTGGAVKVQDFAPYFFRKDS